MATIKENQRKRIEHLYYKQKFSVSEIARELNVGLWSVYYFMRRHGLYRRSYSEFNKVRFEKKTPSFTVRPRLQLRDKELRAAGAMLYWAEGYKSGKASFLDLANSDPEMITIFLDFLRSIFKIDESKLRVFLYCYADQNVDGLMRFWSRITKIPRKQFTKPYVRNDFRAGGKKMKYGLIHIRYMDKKLLLELKRLIEYYKKRFTQVVP